MESSGGPAKKFHGVGIGPLSKILSVHHLWKSKRCRWNQPEPVSKRKRHKPHKANKASPNCFLYLIHKHQKANNRASPNCFLFLIHIVLVICNNGKWKLEYLTQISNRHLNSIWYYTVPTPRVINWPKSPGSLGLSRDRLTSLRSTDVKFIFSKKATKIVKIFTIDLTFTT